jgi:phosphatidylglycerophosphate synthase
VIAGGFPFVFLLLFLGREFWVATVRRFAALRRVEIPSHVFGKLATAIIYWAMLLMAVALMLDVPESMAAWLAPIAVVSMAVGLLLSWAAAWRYTRVLVRRAP